MNIIYGHLRAIIVNVHFLHPPRKRRRLQTCVRKNLLRFSETDKEIPEIGPVRFTRRANPFLLEGLSVSLRGLTHFRARVYPILDFYIVLPCKRFIFLAWHDTMQLHFRSLACFSFKQEFMIYPSDIKLDMNHSMNNNTLPKTCQAAKM